jgi:hypothetical protein
LLDEDLVAIVYGDIVGLSGSDPVRGGLVVFYLAHDILILLYLFCCRPEITGRPMLNIAVRVMVDG